jgi:hypothetical protein
VEAALGLCVPAESREGNAEVEPGPELSRVAVRRLLQKACGVLVSAAARDYYLAGAAGAV